MSINLCTVLKTPNSNHYPLGNLSEGILKQLCVCPKCYSKAQAWHKACSFLDSLIYFTAVYGKTCKTKYWVKWVLILYKYMYIYIALQNFKNVFFFSRYRISWTSDDDTIPWGKGTVFISEEKIEGPLQRLMTVWLV